MKKLPLVGGFFILSSSIPFLLSAFSDWYFHDLSRLAQIVTAIISGLLLGRFPIRNSVPVWIAGACMFALAIRAGRWGVIEALHIALLALCAKAWAGRLRQVHEVHFAHFLIFPALAYLCLILLPRWLALSLEGLSFHPDAFFFGFENPRFFGHWVTLTLPLMIYVAQSDAQQRGLLCCGSWLVVALWIAFLISSGTRGSWLSLGIVAIALPLLGKGGVRLARGTVMAWGLGLFAYGFMFILIPWMAQGDARMLGAERLPEITQLSRRDVLWSLAIEGLSSHLLIGSGPMMFSALPNPVGAHPHNLFLQVAYEWGVICAVLLACFVCRVGLRQVIICRNDGEGARVAVVACIAGGLVQAQVDGILVMPFSQTLFAFLCAWLAALNQEPESRMYENGGGIARFLLIAGAATLLVLCLPELQDLKRWELQGLESNGINLYLPRFWVNGQIPSDPQPFFPSYR
ncbi:O-antigen ligase family protein [Methyloversatilis discipulorum]|uniref:O-antigen ligase family protein n=1 Tax=Methyloversatilis discipulorum TaxID=1119528 RepID=UPI003AF91809